MAGEADAEDLTQVVFERANRSLKDFRGDSSVATWLYRIATNVAVDLLRSPAPAAGTPSLKKSANPTRRLSLNAPPTASAKPSETK